MLKGTSEGHLVQAPAQSRVQLRGQTRLLRALTSPFAFRMSIASIEEFIFCSKTEGFALSEKEIITALEISMNVIHRLPGVH